MKNAQNYGTFSLKCKILKNISGEHHGALTSVELVVIFRASSVQLVASEMFPSSL